MVKITAKIINNNSILRILGAAFFGFLLGSIVRIIVSFATPNILMKINDIDMKDAQALASASSMSNLIIGALIIFLTSFAAGFLAKKKGALVGLLAHLLPIGFWTVAFLFALASGTAPFKLLLSIPFLQFAILVAACVLGGLCGERFYNKDRDLDVDKHGMTIFGVFWLHYLWIVPLIFYPFVSAAVAVIYSWLYTFSTDLYFISDYRLWANIAWWFYFFINPLIILGSGVILMMAFIKFWLVIQYKQTYHSVWEKGGKIVMYGIVTPILIKLAATFAINSTENMFNPVINDWKVGVAYLLIIPTVGIMIKTIWWIKDRLTGKKKK